jgi:membrane-bound lytic murein transglycosylase B
MKKIFAVRFLLLGLVPGLFLLTSCSHFNATNSPLPPAALPASTPAVSPGAPPGKPVEQEIKPDPKMFVEDMLVSKGLKREKVHALVSDSRVTISPGIIVSNLFFTAPAPSAKNPKVMDVDPKYIRKGVDFMDEHEEAFDEAWDRYKISPEVITAILIIETNLGKYPMKYNVFKVYASLTTALDTEYLDSYLKTKGDKYKLTADVLKSARSKGNWGLGELTALIQLSEKLGIDPVSINGSFAGALGPAQFIPTSFVHYGADGNGDGKIDPFNMDDCITSIANYMKLAGWKEEAKLEQKRQAIWIYNHHDVYVNTVMMLYDKLIAAGEEREVPDAGQKTPPVDGAGVKDSADRKGNAPVQPQPEASTEKGADAARPGDDKKDK